MEHHPEVRRKVLDVVRSDALLFQPNYDLTIAEQRELTHKRALRLASEGVFCIDDLRR